MNYHKTIFFLTLIFLFINASSCLSQDNYKSLVLESDKKIPIDFYNKRDTLKKQALNLTDFLPNGYSTKGDVDYTKELQKGFVNGGILLMPDFPILINSKGIELYSNTKLIFQDESRIIIKPNAETHYSAINIQEIENIQIYFANIEGDREQHLITKGEWGMGIRILGSNNIILYAPTVNNSWGDGIYIGPIGQKNSKSISILNPKINNARRNGVSIISVENLLINDGIISNTHGTSPQAAIDIEPDKPMNIVNNIKINNLTTYKNAGDGIMISLSKLTLNEGKSMRPKIVESNIQILNHVDIESFSAARINGRLSNGQENMYDTIRISGKIVFSNPIWSGNKIAVRFSPSPNRILEYGFNPKVEFQNISILDLDKKPIADESSKIKLILEDSKKL